MFPEDEIDAFVPLMELEFLGGPLDGHRELLPSPLPMTVCFKSDAVLKRTPWLLRLSRMFYGKFAEPFHVAVYELTLRREQLVYRFSESIIASEQQRMSGKVWLAVDCAPGQQDSHYLD